MVLKSISNSDYEEYLTILVDIKTKLSIYGPEIKSIFKKIQDTEIPTTKEDTEIVGTSIIMSLNSIVSNIDKTTDIVKEIGGLIQKEYIDSINKPEPESKEQLKESKEQLKEELKSKRKKVVEDIESMNCIN